MSQNDLVIANAAGNVVRADINAALAALGTQQSGTTAPSGVAAGWAWLDTNTPSASMWTDAVYDGADWIERGRLDTSNNRYTSAGAPIWGGTAGGTANALTVTNNAAPAARFPGQRITFIAAAANTGAATLNDNAIGAVAIVRPDGNALLARDILSGHTVEVVWDGTYWRLTDWPPPLILLNRATASSTAQIDFGLSTAFTDYVLDYSAVRPATDAAALVMQTSDDGGSTFEATAGDYNNTVQSTRTVTNDVTSLALASSAYILLSAGSDTSNALVSINGRASLYVGDGTKQPWVRTESSALEDAVSALSTTDSVGLRSSAGAINAIRLKMTSGNISVGQFRLYGVR